MLLWTKKEKKPNAFLRSWSENLGNEGEIRLWGKTSSPMLSDPQMGVTGSRTIAERHSCLCRSLMGLPRVVGQSNNHLSQWSEEFTQNGSRLVKQLVRNYITTLWFDLQIVVKFPSCSEFCLNWTETLVLHLRESNAKVDGCGASAVSCDISVSQTALNQDTAGLARECCMYWNNV